MLVDAGGRHRLFVLNGFLHSCFEIDSLAEPDIHQSAHLINELQCSTPPIPPMLKLWAYIKKKTWVPRI